MAKLSELGEYVKGPSSTLEAPVVRKAREAFPDAKGPAPEPSTPKAASAPKPGAPRPAAPKPAAAPVEEASAASAPAAPAAFAPTAASPAATAQSADGATAASKSDASPSSIGRRCHRRRRLEWQARSDAFRHASAAPASGRQQPVPASRGRPAPASRRQQPLPSAASRCAPWAASWCSRTWRPGCTPRRSWRASWKFGRPRPSRSRRRSSGRLCSAPSRRRRCPRKPSWLRWRTRWCSSW